MKPRFILVIGLATFLLGQRLNGQQEKSASWIDTYIDLRYAAQESDTKELLNNLKQVGIDKPSELEKVLRRKRAQYTDVTNWLGKVSVHAVTCQHVDYSSRYFLYVPKTIDLQKQNPLVIVGHGGNSSMSVARAEATAKGYLQAYRKVADQMKAILVAPASTRGWGQIGNSLMLSTLSRIQRDLPVDPDRIFLTGQSMGGHLSYRSALSLPDRFGAVSPHSGGYDFVAKKSIGNLFNVPGYAVWGVREPYGINKDNRTNRDWGQNHGLDWKFVEKNGGHTIYQDELGKVADFFASHTRNLYRDQVYIRSGGTFKFVKTWQVKGWPEHNVYSDTKPLRWNMRHWLQVEPRPELGEPLTVRAINKGHNQIEITSHNVRQLSVFLHPKMVDLTQAVTIKVNGEKMFDQVAEPNPALMFDLAREFDDRGRIFWCRVDLEIKSDREVEIPAKE